MVNNISEYVFTNKVDDRTARFFYEMIYEIASQKGVDVKIKLSKDGILIIQQVKTKKIA